MKSQRAEFAPGAALAWLERIGRRWTVQVLDALDQAGTLRYNELQRAVEGIPQRSLTLALRDLESGGLLVRTRFPVFPPRVDYEVTARGRACCEQLRALRDWIQAQGVAAPSGQEPFDERPGSPREA